MSIQEYIRLALLFIQSIFISIQQQRKSIIINSILDTICVRLFQFSLPRNVIFNQTLPLYILTTIGITPNIPTTTTNTITTTIPAANTTTTSTAVATATASAATTATTTAVANSNNNIATTDNAISETNNDIETTTLTTLTTTTTNATTSTTTTTTRASITTITNEDPNNSSSDTESVAQVKELKELIKGREVLTFGPDAYGQSNNNNNNNNESEILPEVASTTPLSLSLNGLTKLLDNEGNEYLLHLNGFVTPIIKNHDIQAIENASMVGSTINGRHLVLPTNAAGSPTTLPSSTTTTIGTTVSSMTSRKRRRLNQSPYRNLTVRNSRCPNKLKEFQTQVLELAQFYGDLDLGTNNRFGEVDSTTIIIGTISRSNSSKSSFRSSLRNSLAKDDSSQSSNSPASFQVHKRGD